MVRGPEEGSASLFDAVRVAFIQEAPLTGAEFKPYPDPCWQADGRQPIITRSP